MTHRHDFAFAGEDPQVFGLDASLTYIWDVPTLSWVKSTGGGSGGGAATIADGADVAQGTTTDVAWVAGAGTVISLLKKIASAGGSAVSIADGSDVAEGALADAAVVTDTTGTVSGKLRGLVKWAFERMPAALGQGTMAQSLRVVLPSDQSAVPVSGTVAVTSAGLTNLDVALSTRLKPADTLAAVTTVGTITNPVAVTSAGLTNLDVALSTRLKPADTLAAVTTVGTITNPVAVTSAGLTNLDVALSTRLKPADTLTGVTTVGTVTTITNPVAVTGPLTDAQLRAVAVPVSGTVATGGLTDAQLRATPVDVTGSFSASTAADVFAAEGDAGYTIGDLSKNLTQTDDGRLRVVSAGLISDVPNPYVDGEVRSLSMTTDGRLRVSTTPARYAVPFFAEDEEEMWGEHTAPLTFDGSPWTTW